MKGAVGPLLLCLLLAGGCAAPRRPSPAAPAPVTAPAVTATATPTPAVTASAAPQSVAEALPALPPEGIMGAKLQATEAIFTSFRSHPALFKAVAAALSHAEATGQPTSGATPRFSVDLYLSPTEVWTLAPLSDDAVAVTAGGTTRTLRSSELVRALAGLNALVIPFTRSPLSVLQADLGEGWSGPGNSSDHAEWVNGAMGMRLSAAPWRSVQLDDTGRWSVAERYYWYWLQELAAVEQKGQGRTYPALRFRTPLDSTGGGFWGTWPLQADVVGRGGGLSIKCDSTVWTQDAAKRQAAQALVDQRCPALLQRFTVDLGEPIAPASATPSPGAPAVLQPDGAGWRLSLPQDANVQWLGQRSPRVWQIANPAGEWLLDLDHGKLRPAPLRWPDSFQTDAHSYRLPDGRLVGLIGNQRGATGRVTFVLQDADGATQAALGDVAGGVMALAPAGDSALAYSLYPPDGGYAPGSLWQYDWARREQHRIADQGLPLGRLADGRAVAQRGGRTGELIAWRAATPDDTEVIATAADLPYGPLVSPDGGRLIYFQAEGDAAPNPAKVTAVASYDPASGHTEVRQLPGSGYVNPVSWDGAGNLTFEWRGMQRAAVLELHPDGELVTLTPPGEVGGFIGRDGCTLLFFRNQDIYRHPPEGCHDSGATRIGDYHHIIWSGTLLGFPQGSGMAIVDLQTGKRYWAAGLALPYLPIPHWLQLARLSPESGYVALPLQHYPQTVYQIAAVTPIDV